jgi:hypothetical protein
MNQRSKKLAEPNRTFREKYHAAAARTPPRAYTTTYGGVEYRSRLEARWAAFFERIGWHYTYEPFDGDGYIPDFVIHGASPMVAEVKPAVLRGEYLAPVPKVTQGLERHWRHDILILGADPLPRLDTNIRDWWPSTAGLLGQYFSAEDVIDMDMEPGWDFDLAYWFTCPHCRRTNVLHSVQSFHGRPCGHYDGGYFPRIDLRTIRQHWAEACNDVKWRAE